LRIYPGADGEFTLYEDENSNYNYEKGQFATFQFRWKDKEHQLTISERKGDFQGMLKERTFNVILVNEKNGIGVDVSGKPDYIIKYTGAESKYQFEL